MNKTSIYTVLLMLGAVAVGCREEHLIGEGEGRMLLETSIMSDVKVVSRALTAEQQNDLCNSALIWISDPGKGLLYKFNGITSFPSEGLPLSSGHYAAEAWAGDSVPASRDSKRYRGYQEFEITRGSQTRVELVCPIRNTVVSVAYGDKVAEVLSDLRLTVSLNDGITDGTHGLVYEGLTPDKGYYMLNSRTEGFTWTLEGTELNGKKFSKSGEYKDPTVADKPYLAQTTEYIFRINYDMAGEIEIGGAYFTIEVEPEPVEGEDKEVLVALAPEIEGSGFDINGTLISEPGNAEARSVIITASSALERVELSGSLLTAAGLAPDYELLSMEPEHRDELMAKGFIIQEFRQTEGSDAITNLRLVMDEDFFNNIPEGDYSMNIRATDTEGKENSAVLSVSLSDAPVMAGDNPAIDDKSLSYTSATLSATIKDPSAVSKVGFELMRVSRAFDDWTFMPGTVVGNTVTLTVDDLEAGTTYKWRAVADDFTSKEQTFTTPTYPVLPNAGFEEYTSGTPMLFYSGSEANMFWDSGNHGSKTMNKNVTTVDTSIKHSGNNSVMLKSQFVGLGSIGKFAAGNIFVGKYLKTDGTDGELGWGRELDMAATPKALKGYVKYVPGQCQQAVVNKAYKNPEGWTAGTPDKGIIYVAIMSEKTVTYTDNSKWSAVVKTKSGELFDKAGDNVVAYGEYIIDSATDGEGLVEFTIPLAEVHGDLAPKRIIIVASASRWGDYFLGGEGSTMWLDDLELVF